MLSPLWQQHRAVVLTVGAGVLTVAGYLGLVMAAGPNIPPGTNVAGMDFGGLTEDQARLKITSYAAEFEGQSLTLTLDGQTMSDTASNLGLSVDVEATINALPTPSLHPIDLINALTSERNVKLVLVQDERLAGAIDAFATPLETPLVNASIRFVAGEPQLRPMVIGKTLDRASALQAALDAAANSLPATVPLQLRELRPVVDDVAAAAFIDSTVRSLVSGDVLITVKGHPELSNNFKPAALKEAFRARVVDGKLQAFLAPTVLAQQSDTQFLDHTQPVQDATWDVSSGVPVVVASRSGFGVSDQALASAVESAWVKSGAARTAEVEFRELDPKVTTAAIENLGVKELVSSYTQRFPAAAYRTQNIGQAAAYLNGTLLRPGDEFSMNNTIKERTEANGYTSGWIIGKDGVFMYEPGGGVSTATTATFNAAWFAGLKFKEWRAHSIFISRYPAGREATVSWGSLDMRFVNNYDTAIFITTKMTSTSISVYFWGTKHWDEVGSVSGRWQNLTKSAEVYNTSAECHPQAPVPGFDITVWRTFSRAGVEVKREAFETSYRSTPRVHCGAEPTAKPRPTRTPRPSKTATASPSASASASGSSSATASESTTPEA